MTIHTPVIFTNEVRVLSSITTRGRINSKQIDKIVLLNSSPTFDSKMNFRSLELQSIYSDYLISGIDFNRWYESRIWKNSKDEQIITGNWNIKTAVFYDEVTGNGLINGRSINDIEKTLNENVNQVQAFLSNYTGQYAEMCGTMRSQAESFAKNSIHILKYLELDFKIKEDRDIFSFHEFSTSKNDHYLLVNTECITHIYKWIRSKETFIKSTSFESGVIYGYVSVEHKNGDFYVITNSKMAEGATCKFGGLNSWKLDDNKLIHIKTIMAEPDIVEIYSDPQATTFFALDNVDQIINFDAFGTKLDEWKLPSENHPYSFLPHGVLSGINVYNGRRLFSINSQVLKRNKRTWFDDDKNTRQGNSSRSFVLNEPPKYSLPLIDPIILQAVNENDFIVKVKNVGEKIKSNFELNEIKSSNKEKQKLNVREQETDDRKPLFEFKLPKLFSNSLFNNNPEDNEDYDVDDEKTNEKSTKPPTDLKKNPLNLIFAIKNPKFPNPLNLSEKQSNAGGLNHLNLKSVGKSIFNAVNNPSIAQKNFTEEEIEETTRDENIQTTESTATESSTKFSFTPRIIMNEDDISYDESSESPTLLSPDYSEKQVNSMVMQGNGVKDMENSFIPERGFGEIAVIHVGPADQKKELYAVSKRRSSTVVSSDQGNDFIEVK